MNENKVRIIYKSLESNQQNSKIEVKKSALNKKR